MNRKMVPTLLLSGGMAAALFFSAQQPALAGMTNSARSTSTMPASMTNIEPYRARFGRTQPVIAVVGENAATELTDFVIPYGVLSSAGDAKVLALSTHRGVIKMRPALLVRPDATIADFDSEYPKGADYVIVPAVVNQNDPVLLSWIKAQATKGATIVSICDGALVVANAGLMKGRAATAHWATQSHREDKYPDTRWLRNTRYVADGKIVSSAGISAAMPVSIALVEAISGTAKAASVARNLAVGDWSARHNSDAFRLSRPDNLFAYFQTNYANHWFKRAEEIGLPLAEGVDEIWVAFLADAYSRTGRGKVFSVAPGMRPITSRHGLKFVPERKAGTRRFDLTIAPSSGVPSGRALDEALGGIARRYGQRTAYAVSLDFEYPNYQRASR
jgi:putative intracellular protease/amidase